MQATQYHQKNILGVDPSKSLFVDDSIVMFRFRGLRSLLLTVLIVSLALGVSAQFTVEVGSVTNSHVTFSAIIAHCKITWLSNLFYPCYIFKRHPKLESYDLAFVMQELSWCVRFDPVSFRYCPPLLYFQFGRFFTVFTLFFCFNNC